MKQDQWNRCYSLEYQSPDGAITVRLVPRGEISAMDNLVNDWFDLVDGIKVGNRLSMSSAELWVDTSIRVCSYVVEQGSPCLALLSPLLSPYEGEIVRASYFSDFCVSGKVVLMNADGFIPSHAIESGNRLTFLHRIYDGLNVEPQDQIDFNR